jgi:hypothetical protein
MTAPRQSRITRWMIVAALTVIVCSGLGILALYIASPTTFVSASSAAQRNKLIGTWAGDHGVVIVLRADGVGTSESTKQPDKPMQFDWSVSGDYLEIYQFSRGRSVRYAFNYYVLDRPSSRFTILKSTADEFELDDPIGGTRVRFRRLEPTP